MPTKDIYSDPELHDQIKEEIQASDKGGKPGQWSARKAQFVASEYKKQGGGYKDDGKPGDKKQDDQKNLTNWGKEEWQTKEGDGDAKTEDGNRKRYLPKEAWENMTEDEKEETEQKKLKGGEEGKQFVANADAAKQKGKEAREQTKDEQQQEDVDMEEASELQDDDDDDDAQDEDGDEDEEDEEYEEDDNNEEDQDDNKETGDKRKRPTRSNASSKKQKSNSGKAKDQQSNNTKSNGTHGSKHDSTDEPGAKGSNDRLPKKGQRVSWKAMPGWVHGKVLEIITTEKDMHGKHVKASEDDPRIALEAESGKFCVHKPDNCYFDDE